MANNVGIIKFNGTISAEVDACFTMHNLTTVVSALRLPENAVINSLLMAEGVPDEEGKKPETKTITINFSFTSQAPSSDGLTIKEGSIFRTPKKKSFFVREKDQEPEVDEEEQ